MENQQRFCTTCGQALAPGTTFCGACGTRVSAPPAAAPGQLYAGAQPGYLPPNAQAPMQGQDDLLLAGLAALTGPFIGVALTNGRPHLILAYVAGGMVVFFILVLLIGMLATRGGREALSDGCLGGG
jgi:zinc-ribbon domain